MDLDMKPEEVCDKYYGLVYACCRQKINRPDLAYDAAQTVMQIYLEKNSSFDQTVFLSSWFYKTSNFVCIWFNRNQIKHKELMSVGKMENEKPDLDAEFEKYEQQKIVIKAIEDLPNGYRNLILKKYFENESTSNLAIHYKKSESAIRKRVDVATKRLAEILSKKYDVHTSFSILIISILENSNYSNSITSPSFSIIKYKIFSKGVLKMVLIQKITKFFLVTLICVIGVCGVHYYATNNEILSTQQLEAKENAITRARDALELNMIRQAGILCVTFYNDNGGKLPATTADLAPYIDIKDKAFLDKFELITFGNFSEIKDQKTVVLARSKHVSSVGKRAVVFADGHAELVDK